MKILFLGRFDYANAANKLARSMNEATNHVMAKVATLETVNRGYTEDIVLDQDQVPPDLVHFSSETDWVISTGDGFYLQLDDLVKKLPLPSSVKFATMHAGSAYRRQPNFYNSIDHGFFSARFVGSDLFRFAPDKITIPYYNVGVPPVESIVPATGRLLVGHSPSIRERKGTELISSVLANLAHSVDFDLIENVPYEECLRRRSRCHIFIDQMHPKIGGFGASSMEAMGQGCAVLADMRHVSPECWKFYQKPPILDVRDKKRLRETILYLASEKNHLEEIRSKSVAWIKAHTNPVAISSYFLSHLERKTDLRTRSEIVSNRDWWKENWKKPSPDDYE